MRWKWFGTPSFMSPLHTNQSGSLGHNTALPLRRVILIPTLLGCWEAWRQDPRKVPACGVCPVGASCCPSLSLQGGSMEAAGGSAGPPAFSPSWGPHDLTTNYIWWRSVLENCLSGACTNFTQAPSLGEPGIKMGAPTQFCSLWVTVH